jgi:hypothetical protein
MLNFFLVSIIGIVLICTTSLITYYILSKVWKILPHLSHYARIRVLLVMAPIFIAHMINIWLYAIVFFTIENFTEIGKLVGQGREFGLNYQSFYGCLYFSSTTYTSLGFGDIVPTQSLHILTAAEVLNGLILIGWTISFTYLVMEKFWVNHHKN